MMEEMNKKMRRNSKEVSAAHVMYAPIRSVSVSEYRSDNQIASLSHSYIDADAAAVKLYEPRLTN
jgi:hypothetical protein